MSLVDFHDNSNDWLMSQQWLLPVKYSNWILPVLKKKKKIRIVKTQDYWEGITHEHRKVKVFIGVVLPYKIKFMISVTEHKSWHDRKVSHLFECNGYPIADNTLIMAIQESRLISPFLKMIITYISQTHNSNPNFSGNLIRKARIYSS